MVVSTFNVHGSPTEFLPCSSFWPYLKMLFFSGILCWILRSKCAIWKKVEETFQKTTKIWSNKFISPSSISLIASLRRLFIDISNCYDSPGGNIFSSKSKGNWCAVLTHPVLQLLKYMLTQTFQIKTRSAVLPHFPWVYYGTA